MDISIEYGSIGKPIKCSSPYSVTLINHLSKSEFETHISTINKTIKESARLHYPKKKWYLILIAVVSIFGIVSSIWIGLGSLEESKRCARIKNEYEIMEREYEMELEKWRNRKIDQEPNSPPERPDNTVLCSTLQSEAKYNTSYIGIAIPIPIGLCFILYIVYALRVTYVYYPKFSKTLEDVLVEITNSTFHAGVHWSLVTLIKTTYYSNGSSNSEERPRVSFYLHLQLLTY